MPLLSTHFLPYIYCKVRPVNRKSMNSVLAGHVFTCLLCKCGPHPGAGGAWPGPVSCLCFSAWTARLQQLYLRPKRMPPPPGLVKKELDCYKRRPKGRRPPCRVRRSPSRLTDVLHAQISYVWHVLSHSHPGQLRWVFQETVFLGGPQEGLHSLDCPWETSITSLPRNPLLFLEKESRPRVSVLFKKEPPTPPL